MSLALAALYLLASVISYSQVWSWALPPLALAIVLIGARSKPGSGALRLYDDGSVQFAGLPEPFAVRQHFVFAGVDILHFEQHALVIYPRALSELERRHLRRWSQLALAQAQRVGK